MLVAIILLIVALAVLLMAWAVRGRRSPLLGSSVWRGPRARRALALTFDDGPSESTSAPARTARALRRESHVFPLRPPRPPPAPCRLSDRPRWPRDRQSHRYPRGALPPLAVLHPRSDRPRAGLHPRGDRPRPAPFPRAPRRPLVRLAGCSAQTRSDRRDVDRRSRAIGCSTAPPWPAAWNLAPPPAPFSAFHDGRELRHNPDIGATLEALELLLPRWAGAGYEFLTVSELLWPSTTHSHNA